MTKKRISSIILLLIIQLVFLLSAIECSANVKVPTPTIKENVFIYDEDNCIDDESQEKLNRLIVELEEKTNAEFAVISITSLNDLTIEEYAYNLFNQLGIGKKDQDNGVLLLFSRSDNKVRLEIGRGLEGCLNDAKCGRILDEYFVPYREEDKYTEATEFTVKAVLNVITEEYGIQIEDLENMDIPSDSESELPKWIWVLIILLIILYVIAGGSSTGGSRYYGGHSGRSSGGFSSRGGFGRGISGGGGASR